MTSLSARVPAFFGPFRGTTARFVLLVVALGCVFWGQADARAALRGEPSRCLPLFAVGALAFVAATRGGGKRISAALPVADAARSELRWAGAVGLALAVSLGAAAMSLKMGLHRPGQGLAPGKLAVLAVLAAFSLLLAGFAFWRGRNAGQRWRLTPFAGLSLWASVCFLIVFFIARHFAALPRSAPSGTYHPRWVAVLWLAMMACAVLALLPWRRFRVGERTKPTLTGIGRLFGLEFAWPRSGGVASAASPENIRRCWLNGLLLLILAGYVGVSLYRLGDIPVNVHQDACSTALDGAKLLDDPRGDLFSYGWYYLPRMTYLFSGVTQKIFGRTLFGMRMSSFLLGLLSVWFLFRAVDVLFSRPCALLSAFVLASNHYFIALSRDGQAYIQTIFFTVLVLYLFAWAIRGGGLLYFVLAGCALGVGVQTYPASRAIPFLLGGTVLWGALLTKGFLRKNAFGFALLILFAALTFAPLYAQALHDWKNLLSRQGQVSIFDGGRRHFMHLLPFQEPENAWERFSSEGVRRLLHVRNGLLGLTPEQPAYASDEMATGILEQTRRGLWVFNASGDTSTQYGHKKDGMFDPFSAAMLVLGVAFAAVRIRDWRYMTLLVWTLGPLIAGGVLTVDTPFYPRLAGILPFGAVLAALAIERSWAVAGRLFGFWGRLIRIPALVLLLILMAWANHRIYFVSYNRQERPMGTKTAIGHYLRQRGAGNYTYLIGLYFRTPTIQFLAPEARGEYVRAPESFFSERRTKMLDCTIVLAPSQTGWLSRVRKLYPEATLSPGRNDKGQILFYALEFPAGS